MHKVKKLFVFQFVITIALAFFCSLGHFKWIAIYSALLGGAVCIFPTSIFAMVLFYRQGATRAKDILNNFYRGEVLKIVISVCLFALVYRFFTINPLIFIMTYSLVSTLSWFCALYSETKVKVIK